LCRTLLLKCIQKEVPYGYEGENVDKTFEQTLVEVLSYFSNKITSEEFRTESEDQEEVIELK